MINIKSSREIDLMRKAGKIVALCHEEVAKIIAPGVSTEELDNLVERLIIENGATPSFKGYHGYPASICASVNDVIVHGIPSEKIILKEGDIIGIDIGACYKGYHGDSAWTYPVGKISHEDQKLLDVTRESLFIGLSKIKSGVHVGDISSAIYEYCNQFGYGVVEDFTGHGIGKNLHEDPMVPNFGKPNTGPILKSGMTICIEPMINQGTKRVKLLKDNWTTKTADGKNSAHFEHQVVVTDDGYEILTML